MVREMDADDILFGGRSGGLPPPSGTRAPGRFLLPRTPRPGVSCILGVPRPCGAAGPV